VGRIRATSGIFGFLVTFQEKPLKFQEIEKKKILIINRVIIERKKKGKKSHDFSRKRRRNLTLF